MATTVSSTTTMAVLNTKFMGLKSPSPTKPISLSPFPKVPPPPLNQLNKMRRIEKEVVIGLGLNGLLLSAQQAQASEIGAIAAAAAAAEGGTDNRGTLLLFVLLPAIGWVLFNILQPALNQLNKMRNED